MKGREKAAQEGGEDAPNLLQVAHSAPDGGLGRHATLPPRQ